MFVFFLHADFLSIVFVMSSDNEKQITNKRQLFDSFTSNIIMEIFSFAFFQWI